MESEASKKSNAGFSFSIKKRDKNTLQKSSIAEKTENEQEETEFILGIQGNRIESTEPVKEKKELVIPLIAKNRWHGENEGEEAPPRKKTKLITSNQPTIGKTGSKLDDEALRELMKESKSYNESWESRDKDDPSLAIPLLMVNKPPEGFETDDKLDVSIRPNQADEADYDQIPIESFGKAMLRGMGWKEKEGIGNKMKKVVAPIEAVARPKGQGLGADTGPKKKQGPKSADVNGTDEAEGFVKGAGVLIKKGPHKNLYGSIEGTDEDNARLMVKLALSSQIITVSQFGAQSVSKSEYKKYAKDLGRFSKGHNEMERKKAKEESELGKDRGDERRGRSDEKQDSDRHKSPDRSHDRDTSKHRDRDRLRDDGRSDSKSRSSSDRHRESTGTGGRDRDSERSHEKKRRREDADRGGDRKSKYDRSPEPEPELSDSPRADPPRYWLRPDLRVRFIDRSYKAGRHYNSKVQVIDVQERDVCSCRTEEGKLLADIHQSMLETVIPKGQPGYVMVVHGEQRGQVGTILNKDKRKCEADVQMLRECDQIVQLSYDDICEYVGDIHLAEDL